MIVRFDDCELDLGRVRLRRGGSDVRIEPQVFDLLSCLIEHRGEVVRKEQLLDQVWGDRFVSESALTTRIKSARQAVGDDGTRQQVIRTVHGKGYEFVAEVLIIDDQRHADPGRIEVTSSSRGLALPTALSPLIGREQLLVQLVADQATNRLVTLVGAGGVGKTSLGYELARTVAHGYVDGAFAVEICRRLDGIPLAIELAASRASVIDVTEVATRLDERFRLLKGVRRGADPRHQTLHDAISWSYDLLDEDEQRLFASLAVFAGQFDLGAAESVCSGQDVLDLLTRLTRRSMLAVRRPARGGTRYEMLETLREYGRGRLGDLQSGELFSAHAGQFASLARSVEIDLGTAHEQSAVARADGSFADLRAAQRFALQIEDFDTGFGLIGSIREYAMRSLRYEVFAWADATANVTGGTDHPLFPTVTGVRAYGAWVRGEFESALFLAQAARIAETASGVTPSGLAERVLANVLYATGDVETGLIEGARMIELAEDSQNGSRLAHSYYMAAVASSSIGHHDEAKRLIARSRDAGRRTGSPTDLASASVAEGFATYDDPATALDAFATADRLARSAGNRWMSAFARTEASGLLVHQGQLEQGCEGLAEVVDTWYRSGEWAQQWHTLSRCVIALDRIDQQALAAQALGAIELHTTLGGPPVMTTLRNLAFETRDSLTDQLGPDLMEQHRATGASLPVFTLVDQTRNALLGRPIND